MNGEQGESIRFWQTAPLTGVELLTARYIEHRFVPHVHDGFVIGMIMAGAQRYRYRGAEHLAPTGTLVLINPDEVHNGHKGHDAGWRYRAFYPDNAQMHSLLEELNLPGTHLPTFNETLLQDPELFSGLCHLHQLLEGPESALQQQTVWRQMMLALLSRHARLPQPAPPGVEHRAVSQAKELLQTRLVDAATRRSRAGFIATRLLAGTRRDPTGIRGPKPPQPTIQKGLRCGACGLPGRVYLTPINPQLPAHPAATAPFTRPSQRRAAGH